MKYKYSIRLAAMIISVLMILPLASCFDHNYDWDIPEREDPGFDWGVLFGIISPNRNLGVGGGGFILSLADDGSHYIIDGCENSLARAVTLPSSYNGIPITEIALGAFIGMNKLRSIEIPDCITKVGAGAFAGCEKLEYNISGGAKYLGNTANPYAVLIGAADENINGITVHPNTRIIADSAFEENKNITEAVIPRSVEYIGTAAFGACASLRSLVFEGGRCRIGERAFYACKTLSSVDLGTFVSEIGDSAFDDCSSLGSVVIPYSVKHLGKYAFAYCDKLKSVKIGIGVSSIEEHTFLDCSQLTTVELSGSVKRIGDYAFYGCSSLRDEFLPESIEFIGKDAFGSTNMPFRGFNGFAYYIGTEENPYAFLIYYMPRNTDQPNNIVLHQDTKVIARNAFPEGLNADSTVEVYGNDGKYLRSQDNCLIDKESGRLIMGIGKCTVPDDGSVTSIGDYAFYGNVNLPSLFSLPESVTSVGDHAFEKCSNLVSVNLAPSVETVGDYAFASCSLLSEVGFSNFNLKSIGKYAFYECSGLGKIILSESLEYLGDYAFYDCKKLKSASFGSNISEIREGTFNNCIQLESVTIRGAVKRIGKDAFRGCKKLTGFEFAEGLEAIGEAAFISCEGLQKVRLPDSVTEIGDYSFGYCYELGELSIGKGIRMIGLNAFTSIGCNIVYRGSLEEWKGVAVGENYSDMTFKVLCTDGVAEIPPETMEG